MCCMWQSEGGKVKVVLLKPIIVSYHSLMCILISKAMSR